MSEKMDGLFIFDLQNDVIFTKSNDKMESKLVQMCKEQELMDESDTSTSLNSDIIFQLFSPLIASQRIMFCQFDNSYTSLELENDLNLVFEEFLGFVFLKIGNETIDHLQRYVGICIAFIKHLCGPDIFLLKNNSEKCSILNRVLDAWCHEYNESESMLVEGIEHLFINYDLKRTAQKSLEAAIENMKRDPYSQRSHVILFVKNKLLAMCSSRQAQDLSTSDLIFLQLFCRQPSNFVATNSKKLIETHLIFLQGNINGTYSGCIPYIVHISHFNETETFIVLIEYGNLAVSNGLFDVFFAMHKVRILQMQNDMENLRSAYDNLDHFVKQSLDAIKKVKFNNHDIEAATKRFASKWDLLKRKYSELFRNTDKDLILSIESNLPGLNDALKDLFRLICVECNTMEYGLQRITEISSQVKAKIAEVADFLRVKAQQNVVLGSIFKDINGLVYFIHINRNNGRVIIPTLDSNDKRGKLIKKQAREMVEKSRFYLQKGHMSMIWNDNAFYYSYFLWFEDQNGTQLKPKELPNASSGTIVKPQVVPGVLAGEFYQSLIETCFPKNNSKIKCFELYTMYVGLTSPQILLDFNRRLVAILGDNITGLYGPGPVLS